MDSNGDGSRVSQPKHMRVRYAGRCVGCGASIPAGTTATWQPASRTLRCDRCTVSEQPASAALRSSDTAEASPGASAQRRYERLRDQRQQRVRTSYPHIGNLLLAVFDEPQTTKSWAKGAEGERRLGALLDALRPSGVVSLHDRGIPGSRANIDHIAIASTGVFVIDAKRYAGQVEKREVGGWLNRRTRLYVGRRDCTALVSGMERQATAVRDALGRDGLAAPVISVLCFVGAEWTLFARPFEVDGVVVAWPKALAKLLSRAGSLDVGAVGDATRCLSSHLRPA